jgi:hypothetical protein
MRIERKLFEALRWQAIESLPAEFTTEQYIESINAQHGAGGPDAALAERQLRDCETVIRLGKNEWQKIQLVK